MNILITGASSGIGKELAVRYSSPGNNLLLSGRDQFKLHEVMEEGRARHDGEYGWGSCNIVAGDLTDFHTTLRINEYLRDWDNKLDLLILSSGVYDKRDLFVETEDTEIGLRVMNGTLIGNIQVCLQALPELEKARGQIVHINSVAGKNLSPGEAIYSAAKHAMTGFLRSLRLDARNHNVRVMDVFLGGVNTPMCAGREFAEKLMNVHAVASIIKTNIDLNHMRTCQIEELQLGRIIF